MEENFTLTQAPALARQLLAAFPRQRVFAFAGEMGAGKTTFIHAICAVLGVQDGVSSPTFALINQYTAQDEAVYHIDLYRLRDEEEALQVGVEDCLYSGNYCFVEWPERAAGLFPDDTVAVQLAVIDGETRKLTVG